MLQWPFQILCIRLHRVCMMNRIINILSYKYSVHDEGWVFNQRVHSKPPLQLSKCCILHIQGHVCYLYLYAYSINLVFKTFSIVYSIYIAYKLVDIT